MLSNCLTDMSIYVNNFNHIFSVHGIIMVGIIVVAIRNHDVVIIELYDYFTHPIVYKSAGKSPYHALHALHEISIENWF